VLDSPIVEVAIGLSVLFFLLAAAASSVVELISGALGKRSKDLEQAVATLVGDVDALRETSVFQALAGRKGKFPSYIPARAFASAVDEARKLPDVVDKITTLADGRFTPVARRIEAISDEVGDDLVRLRAGLETWFDDAMHRLGGAYKRWTMVWLFAVGLVLAVGLNASATQVAANLWNDPTARQAVADSASNIVESQTTGSGAGDASLTDVADRLRNQLDQTLLPIGWSEPNRPSDTWGWVGQVAGWLVTAAMVCLGAPFWFGLLNRVVSLRTTGSKPPPASEDDQAASTSTSDAGA
jgi:hypothetical protein